MRLFFGTFRKRREYYSKCQHIIDDLHYRVANNMHMTEQQCEMLYGESEYRALTHELHLMKAYTDLNAMTSAMEWLYHSQYFRNKAKSENRQATMFWISVISACFAVASAVYTFCSHN